MRNPLPDSGQARPERRAGLAPARRPQHRRQPVLRARLRAPRRAPPRARARAGCSCSRRAGTGSPACPVSQRATKLQVPVLAGWRTPYSFLGTPLVARGRPSASFPSCSWTACAARLTGVAVLDQMSRESAAWTAFEDAIAPRATWWPWPGATSTARPSPRMTPGRRCRCPHAGARTCAAPGGGSRSGSAPRWSSCQLEPDDKALARVPRGSRRPAGRARRAPRSPPSATHAAFFTDMCRALRAARPARADGHALRRAHPRHGHAC